MHARCTGSDFIVPDEDEKTRSNNTISDNCTLTITNEAVGFFLPHYQELKRQLTLLIEHKAVTVEQTKTKFIQCH